MAIFIYEMMNEYKVTKKPLIYKDFFGIILYRVKGAIREEKITYAKTPFFPIFSYIFWFDISLKVL